jgi:hypothetical protein
MESLEVKKYYRCVFGQRNGRVEAYLAESEYSIYFESGRFVAKDQFASQLMEIQEDEYKAKFTEQDLPQAPPLVPQTIEEWEADMSGQPIESVTPTPETQVIEQKEKSPIRIILEKQKKLSKLNLNFILENLDFPNNKVLEFLTMMFEEEEIINEMTEFIFSQMSQEDINKCIKDSIKNHILTIEANSDE